MFLPRLNPSQMLTMPRELARCNIPKIHLPLFFSPNTGFLLIPSGWDVEGRGAKRRGEKRLDSLTLYGLGRLFLIRSL